MGDRSWPPSRRSRAIASSRLLGAIIRTSPDGSPQARMSSWSTHRSSTLRRRAASSRLGSASSKGRSSSHASWIRSARATSFARAGFRVTPTRSSSGGRDGGLYISPSPLFPPEPAMQIACSHEAPGILMRKPGFRAKDAIRPGARPTGRMADIDDAPARGIGGSAYDSQEFLRSGEERTCAAHAIGSHIQTKRRLRRCVVAQQAGGDPADGDRLLSARTATRRPSSPTWRRRSGSARPRCTTTSSPSSTACT